MINIYKFQVAELIPNRGIAQTPDEIVGVHYDIEYVNGAFIVHSAQLKSLREVFRERELTRKYVENDGRMTEDEERELHACTAMIINEESPFIGAGFKVIPAHANKETLNVLCMAERVEDRERVYLVSDGNGNTMNIDGASFTTMLARKLGNINTNVTISKNGRVTPSKGCKLKRILV